MNIEQVIERIQQLSNIKNESLNKSLENCGLGKNAIYNMKNGKIPGADKIFKLAQYFNITTDYLLGNTDDPSPPNSTLTTVQFEILQQLERLTPEQLDAVKALISGFSLRKD